MHKVIDRVFELSRKTLFDLSLGSLIFRVRKVASISRG
jgi:hypothetical protein